MYVAVELGEFCQTAMLFIISTRPNAHNHFKGIYIKIVTPFLLILLFL